MKKKKWTQKDVRDLKSDSKNKKKYVQVGPNCFVCVYPSERKTYIKRWTKDKRKHEKVIGTTDQITLKEAISQCAQVIDITVPTFKEAAETFFKRHIAITGQRNQDRFRAMLNNELFPVIANKTLYEITINDWIDIFNKIDERGASRIRDYVIRECARMVKSFIPQWPKMVNHPEAIKGTTFKKHVKKHFAAVIESCELGTLLDAIDKHTVPVVRFALKFQAWSMLRPGTTVKLQWQWVDFEKRLITIPARYMKQNRFIKDSTACLIQSQDHVLPMSTQIVSDLKTLRMVTGDFNYVFCCARSRSDKAPIKIDTLSKAIRDKKLPFAHHPHGFRATARTLLEEVFQLQEKLLHLQLGHIVRKHNGLAYNRTRFLKARSEMMQLWSDYLDWLLEKAQKKEDIPDNENCNELFLKDQQRVKTYNSSANDNNKKVIPISLFRR